MVFHTGSSPVLTTNIQNNMITQYFYSEASMNSYISEYGIERKQVSFMGYISGGRWQLSYWKYI